MTTHYVYGAGGLLYGEYDNAGDFIREYVYLDSAPLAQVDAGAPEAVTYLHPDHLGTPRYGTDAGGTQVWAWAGDAFGVGAPTGSATVNIRMPGQYADAESGLFYNWNRYYNPAIGRYISSDPIGLEGGINTFLYAAASPVIAIDPSGEQGGTLIGPGMQQTLALGMGCLQSGSAPGKCFPPPPKLLISLPNLEDLPINPETVRCLAETSAICKGAVLGCPDKKTGLVVGGICGFGTTVGCLLYYELPRKPPVYGPPPPPESRPTQ